MASAQVRFRATLAGDDEVPPVTTKATGWATFTLNQDKTVTYFLNSQGLQATGAFIQEAPPGATGPIAFTLSGGPDIFSGTTIPLTIPQIDTLRSAGFYVNVITATNPTGENRGQVLIRPILFGAHLEGAQELPPVTTDALGDAQLTVNADNTMTYGVKTTGLLGTEAHIHLGAPGVRGPILFTLSGGPTVWAGTTATALLPNDFSAMQELGVYIDVHTTAFPDGEIRGQVVNGMSKYGEGCPGLNGIPALFGTGAPTPGGTITVKVNQGLASGAGVLILSLAADAVSSSGCGYYLGSLTSVVPVSLDATGRLSASLVMPDLPTTDFYLQFFGADTSAANGEFSTSNGLHMPFTSL